MSFCGASGPMASDESHPELPKSGIHARVSMTPNLRPLGRLWGAGDSPGVSNRRRIVAVPGGPASKSRRGFISGKRSPGVEPDTRLLASWSDQECPSSNTDASLSVYSELLLWHVRAKGPRKYLTVGHLVLAAEAASCEAA
jgi:hypothetical protein